MKKQNRINALRKSRNISQQMLGDILGISQQNVSRIESHSVPDISSDLLCKIADYFQVTVDYLLDRDDKPNDTEYPDADPLQIYRNLTPEDRRLWMNVGARMLGYSQSAERGESRRRVR